MASLALLLLAPLALAQTTTIQVPLFGFDEQSIDASVVGVTSQLTTFSLACAPGADSNDCGIAPTHLLTYGPSKYIMTLADGDEFTGVQNCAVTATAPAAGAVTAFCTESFSGSDANSPGSNTTTYTDGTFAPLRVTAGASLLTAAQTGAGVTTSASGPTAASTGSTSRPTTAASTGSLTGTAAAPANTNAAPALGVEVLGGLFGVAAGVAGLLYI